MALGFGRVGDSGKHVSAGSCVKTDSGKHRVRSLGRYWNSWNRLIGTPVVRSGIEADPIRFRCFVIRGHRGTEDYLLKRLFDFLFNVNIFRDTHASCES